MPQRRSDDKGDPGLTTRARELRKNMTEAEALLWSHLRARQVADTRFNSQFKIGGCICDFVSRGKRLIIELDGGQHATQVEKDARRTAFLESRGYRVIRFWNHDVLTNLEGVVQTIEQVLRDSPSPNPSRKREGSKLGRSNAGGRHATNLPSRLREGPGEGLSKP